MSVAWFNHCNLTILFFEPAAKLYCQVGKGRDLDFNSIMSRGRDEFREIWGGNTANNRHRRAS